MNVIQMFLECDIKKVLRLLTLGITKGYSIVYVVKFRIEHLVFGNQGWCQFKEKTKSNDIWFHIHVNHNIIWEGELCGKYLVVSKWWE